MSALPHPAPDPVQLDELHGRVWAELTRAARDRGHGWRQVTLATVDHEGAPDARTVILREADASQQVLRFYTDARSPKAGQIQQQPQGLIVAWCPELAWQLRLRVQLSLLASGLAVSSRWASMQLSRAANDYLAPQAPGSTLDAAGAAHDGPPAGENRGHFAVIEARVVSIDWLSLQPSGHRRALLGADGARWLQP